MKVSVLMTYYNKGAFVEEAVHSVLASTFGDFELLVVDDASTDDGISRIRAIDDQRIRILESPANTGRAAAANRGFAAARGEYIAVLDADDRMLPDRLARQVAFMDQFPAVGVSGGHLRTFGSDSVVLTVHEKDGDARAMALFGMPVYYSTCIMRKQVLLDSGVRCDPAWIIPGMDHIFMLRLAVHTRMANLPEVLTEYRRGAQNMRHGRDPLVDRLALAGELFRALGIPTQEGGPEWLCVLEGVSPAPLDAGRVRGLWEWMQWIQRSNKGHGWFDPVAFRCELNRRWWRLYHTLPDHAPDAAWAHVMRTRPFPWQRALYLTRMGIKRALGTQA